MATAGYIVLTLKFRKVDRRWTAYCEELGTATFGRSLPEADKKLKEAVLLQLSTLEEVGERARFFREQGIEFHHTKPKKEITISVPLTTATFIETHIQPVRELAAV